MPDINDIHGFYEANLPEYQRRHIIEGNKFFLALMAIPIQKPINAVIHNFQKFKEFVCFQWQGYKEIKTIPLPKQKTKNMSYPKFTDQSLMPYGKYKGSKMANVPPDYLIWLLDNDRCSGDVKKYIEANKSVLETEIKQNKKQQNR